MTDTGKIALSLVGSYWREAAVMTLAGGIWLAIHQRDAANVERGRAMERLRASDSTLQVLTAQRPKIVYEFVHDTLRLTMRVAQLDTIRDTVLHHLTDTVRVKEFIATADATVQACRDVLNSCAALHRNDSLTIRALEQKVHDIPIAAKPRRCGFGATLGGGVVHESGFHVGPSITAGVTCLFR